MFTLTNLTIYYEYYFNECTFVHWRFRYEYIIKKYIIAISIFNEDILIFYNNVSNLLRLSLKCKLKVNYKIL